MKGRWMNLIKEYWCLVSRKMKKQPDWTAPANPPSRASVLSRSSLHFAWLSAKLLPIAALINSTLRSNGNWFIDVKCSPIPHLKQSLEPHTWSLEPGVTVYYRVVEINLKDILFGIVSGYMLITSHNLPQQYCAFISWHFDKYTY